MTSFFGGIIARNMEDAKERQYAAQVSRAAVQERAEALVGQRNKPTKAPMYWKSDNLLETSRRDWALSGENGKGAKYLAGPTAKANSYEAVLDIYAESDAA